MNNTFSDIQGTLEKAGMFTFLLQLIQASNISLEGKTLLAPSDDTFLRVPPAKRARLMYMPPEIVVKYHILPEPLLIHQIPQYMPTLLEEAPCLFCINQGPQMRIGSGLNGNGAYVVRPNVICSNGIIHVIDRPLLPPLPINMCYDEF